MGPIDRNVMTRAQAKALGLSHYNTGRPCKRGHTADRAVGNATCVECRKEHYWANPEKYRADASRKAKEYRQSRATNPELWVGRSFDGLPPPTRPMPDNCECCGRDRQGKILNLDHCHNTGLFRGWLCGTCNSGMGFFKDSPENLERAAAYLRTHGVTTNGSN